MLNPRPFVHSTDCENGRPPAWRTPVSIWTFVINHSSLRPGLVFVTCGTFIGWGISKLVF